MRLSASPGRRAIAGRRLMVRLAWRMLWRDWKAGELHILLLALIVAVSSMTAVGFFTDRIYRALQGQARSLLGADLVVVADHDIRHDYRPYADRFSVRACAVTEFSSMAFTATHNHLVSVKAVEADYPLRGRIRISQHLYSTGHIASGIPAPGTVWVESRLLNALGLDVGQTLSLGQAQFRVAAILVNDPAVPGGGLFSLAHRLIMNASDLDSTGLLQPTSRIRYRMLFSGQLDKINQLGTLLKQRLKRGERLERIEDARPEIRNALERARRFLNMAVLTCVLLSFAALATTSQRYLRRHLDACAVMRCMGASHQRITWLFVWQILSLGIIATVGGCLAGFLLQAGLIHLIAPYINITLPAAGFRPLLTGIVTGLFGLLGFVMPSILQLKSVPALRVIRRDLGTPRSGQLALWLTGFSVFAVLVFWQSGEWRLGVYMLVGFAVTLSLLLLASLGLIFIARLLRRHASGVWRLGLGALLRRPLATALQISAFGIGALAMLLLTLVRTDLLETWQDKLPVDAPNRFLINIQADQLAGLDRFFRDRHRAVPAWMPMIRARLVAVNSQPVGPDTYASQRAKRLVTREFNLSWNGRLQEDNEVTAGKWWTTQDYGRPVVSVEADLADTLGLHVGDTLEFKIAGEPLSVKIMNLRKVRWDSFRANFFVLAVPGLLDAYPASYIASIYLPSADGNMLTALVNAFPNVTVIDVDAIMNEVRGIIRHVSQAVQYVFILALISSLLVMFAAIHATLDERMQENALIRSLGGRSWQLAAALWLEFAMLGFAAGLIAAVCADAVGMLVARRLFQIEYTMQPLIWLAGMFGTAVVIAIAGWFGSRRVLTQSPASVLGQQG